MGQHTHTLASGVPLDYAFNYVTDYRYIPDWVMGVTTLTPIGEQCQGAGAIFDSEINLGPFALPIVLTYAEWQENRVFTAHISKGLEGSLSLSFESLGEMETRISAVLDYRVGKGLAGKLLEKVLQAFIPACFGHIDTQLRHQLSTRYSTDAPLSPPSP